MPERKRAFSLIELSIVLVILGLLVGGILAGQALIRASEMRSVCTEYSRYVTAISAFRDKYFQLPGDFNNATALWGLSANCPGTPSTPSTDATTCNGNDDGKIGTTTTSYEFFRSWQHLADAGLIEGGGSYTGVPNIIGYGYSSALGSNVPASHLSGAGWTLIYVGPVDVTSTTFFEGNYSNVFYFGGVQPNDDTYKAILTPTEAWNIDTKLDDGAAGTGRITTLEQNTGCHNAGTSTTVALALTAQYKTSTNTIQCPLIMKTGY